jgi:hypothetical protein
MIQNALHYHQMLLLKEHAIFTLAFSLQQEPV